MNNTEIKITDDYKVGKLYLLNQEYELSAYDPIDKDMEKLPSFIYDKNSHNVHIFPLDIALANSCSDFVAKKRSSIFEEIKVIDESLIRKNKRGGVDGGGSAGKYKETAFANSNKLFQFIPLRYKNLNYDLIFIRFFKDDTSVSCILNCFQLKIYEGKEPAALENYPRHGDDSMLYDGESVYYNFPVDFNEPAKVVAIKLIRFIKDHAEIKK